MLHCLPQIYLLLKKKLLLIFILDFKTENCTVTCLSFFLIKEQTNSYRQVLFRYFYQKTLLESNFLLLFNLIMIDNDN